MTHPDIGRDVGRLLGSQVPDLTAPPDRLAAVGRRVRRRRLRQTVLAAACVTLALLGMPALVAAGRTGTVDWSATPQPAVPQPAVPQWSAVPQRPDAGSCPAQVPVFPYGNGALPKSAPGVLAPAGAVRALLCQYNPLPEHRMVRPGPARQLVLTNDVAGLVAALNQLPAEAGIDPCFIGGIGGYLTLVYRDDTSVTIELGGCGFVRRGEITRHDGWDASRAFAERYRQQELARAVPGAVPPADCAPWLMPGVRLGLFTPDPVTDVWLRGAGYLPGPLAVVTACRYIRGNDGSLVLTKQVSDRGAVRQMADAVEAAHRTDAGEIPFASCTSGGAVRTLDVLVLRDVVGETVEVRVTRDTCPMVTFGFSAAPPSAAVSTAIDQLLGPPM